MNRKLRICNLYPDKRTVGRNDGNPLYMTHTLRKMGHDVKHVLPCGDIRAHGEFDLYLWCDWGEDALNWDSFTCPRPNAYWTSDTHLGYDYRLKKAAEFDYVFCAQKQAKEDFEKVGIKNVLWLPHAVAPDVYYPQESIKKYDICFVGHVNSDNRARKLDRLFREFPEFWYGQALFEDAAAVFCQSKIVFNSAIKDDVNMRVFEALATRSLLLTEAVSTLDELFTDGVHLVTYETEDEMIEKARYYLAHELEAHDIAEMGYRKVLESHTFKHRAETILQTAGLLENKLTQEAAI